MRSRLEQGPLPSVLFYMMRHGQTVANREGWAAGAFDTPLTDQGREQARTARRGVASLEPRPRLVCFSSLSRARETALLATEGLELPSREEDGLQEQDFGLWRGLSWADVKARLDKGETPEGGESLAAVEARVKGALGRILKEEGPVLIVSHGGVFDALLRLYGLSHFSVKNCGIYAFFPSPDPGGPLCVGEGGRWRPAFGIQHSGGSS